MNVIMIKTIMDKTQFIFEVSKSNKYYIISRISTYNLYCNTLIYITHKFCSVLNKCQKYNILSQLRKVELFINSGINIV